MAEKPRPDRVELFAFYYLSYRPDGTFRFANANHVARHYGVSPDAVLRWLEEYKLEPERVLQRRISLPSCQVDLELESGNLTEEGILARVREILEEVDQAGDGRVFWEDTPF